MTAQQSVLIVEDDRGLAETLAYNFRQEGFHTGIARTGLEAISITRSQHPDIVILDVMLPEMDGFEVCRTVRATSPVPIIMLTARTDEVDRVLGFELGADDYITKPFSLRELLARVRAALRRVQLSSGTPNVVSVREAGALRITPGSRGVTRDGRALHLLPREFDLLLYFMQNQGQVLSRDQLLQKVWGANYLGDARTVDVHVRRLRIKIEVNASDPLYIRTVYGVGYVFDGQSEGTP
ncbi:MAG: response regulator transcription factor [Chloroflexota bacterium]